MIHYKKKPQTIEVSQPRNTKQYKYHDTASPHNQPTADISDSVSRRSSQAFRENVKSNNTQSSQPSSRKSHLISQLFDAHYLQKNP